MSAADIQQAIRKLSTRELEELRDFIDNCLEDRLEMADQFKTRILEQEVLDILDAPPSDPLP